MSSLQARVKRVDVGWAALIAAVLVLSLGSTFSKKIPDPQHKVPGLTIGCVRSLIASGIWFAILLARGRWVTWQSLKSSLGPGALFGINIAFFFSAVTHTRVANVEFTGSLNPLVLVPLGAFFFHEHVPWRALMWAVPAIPGVALVAFFAEHKKADQNGLGMLLAVGAIGTWSAYLLVIRRLRYKIEIDQFMAGMCLGAGLILLPFSLHDGFVSKIPGHGWPWLLMLTVQNGVIAHTLLLVAQRTIPVGTISTLQVSQPALAAGAAWLLLGEHVRPIQFVGMAIVIASLVLYTLALQRKRSAVAAAAAAEMIAVEPVHE